MLTLPNSYTSQTRNIVHSLRWTITRMARTINASSISAAKPKRILAVIFTSGKLRESWAYPRKKLQSLCHRSRFNFGARSQNQGRAEYLQIAMLLVLATVRFLPIRHRSVEHFNRVQEVPSFLRKGPNKSLAATQWKGTMHIRWSLSSLSYAWIHRRLNSLMDHRFTWDAIEPLTFSPPIKFEPMRLNIHILSQRNFTTI